MKSTLRNTALLGMLFVLGACSVAEGKFLKKVEGKTMRVKVSDDLVGSFTSDGKTFTLDSSYSTDGTAWDLKLDKVTDENTAIYTVEGIGQELIFTTTEGKTGSYTGIGVSNPIDVTLTK